LTGCFIRGQIAVGGHLSDSERSNFHPDILSMIKLIYEHYFLDKKELVVDSSRDSNNCTFEKRVVTSSRITESKHGSLGCFDELCL
jgi:hypothetical protein